MCIALEKTCFVFGTTTKFGQVAKLPTLSVIARHEASFVTPSRFGTTFLFVITAKLLVLPVLPPC